MKTLKWMTGMAVCAALSLSACTSMDEGLNVPAETGQGELTISLASGTNFTEETRALNEASFANTANYTVLVLDKDKNEKLNCTGSEIVSIRFQVLGAGAGNRQAYYNTNYYYARDTRDLIKEGNSIEIDYIIFGSTPAQCDEWISISEGYKMP